MNNIDLMNYWIENSNRDYEAMQKNFEAKQYTWTLFIGHLVVEKLLKALYARNNKSAPYAPKTHDLYFLATKLQIQMSEEQKILLNTITRFNLDGRYDDYKNNFYNLCDENYTRESITKINNIRNWLLEMIENESEENKNE